VISRLVALGLLGGLGLLVGLPSLGCVRDTPPQSSDRVSPASPAKGPARAKPAKAKGPIEGKAPACRAFETPPGAPARSRELQDRLRAAWRRRPAGYRPRTRHLCDAAPRYLNRLLLEKSPYLRQHAHNPVDWYPWGKAAFARARALGRPVLLSVGYATCHWCHVMERESFEDPAIAKLLNQRYVAIKVDREELPHVDATYMSALQLIKRSGGWPLTVWLLPDRRPFYAASYLPPRDGDRGARRGFASWLRLLAQAFADKRKQVESSAAKLARGVRVLLLPPPGKTRAVGADTLPGFEIHDALQAHYAARYDSTYGGLRRAPKFPSSLSIAFLLRQHARRRAAKPLAMATQTLTEMARGGLFDQLGGGFHRYSTDARWRVPHFEKMLYDQALLVLAYLEGYQASGQRRFGTVAQRTLDYVLARLAAPKGGFYAATDADSADPQKPAGERREGLFFSWTPSEIKRVLGPARAPLAIARFGVREAGDLEGRSVLHVAKEIASLAAERGLKPTTVKRDLRALRAQLLVARAKRPRPLRDDKVITGWNGLMVAALARGAWVLNSPRYLLAAERSAERLWRELRRPNGRLLRRLAAGQAAHPGTLDDHAYLLWGLLELFEASGKLSWLQRALALEAVIARDFEDRAAGGFYSTAKGTDVLLGRQKPYRDNARPSANAVQAMNLLRLYQLTDRDALRRRGLRTLRAFARPLRESPASVSELLLAHGFAKSQPLQIVLVRPQATLGAQRLEGVLRRSFVPHRVLVRITDKGVTSARKLLPLVEGKRALSGKATAYVCVGGSCKRPTSDPAVLRAQLQSATAR
jgi:uncharacterized protein YyaL (SSP411 family)